MPAGGAVDDADLARYISTTNVCQSFAYVFTVGNLLRSLFRCSRFKYANCSYEHLVMGNVFGFCMNHLGRLALIKQGRKINTLRKRRIASFLAVSVATRVVLGRRRRRRRPRCPVIPIPVAAPPAVMVGRRHRGGGGRSGTLGLGRPKDTELIPCSSLVYPLLRTLFHFTQSTQSMALIFAVFRRVTQRRMLREATDGRTEAEQRPSRSLAR